MVEKKQKIWKRIGIGIAVCILVIIVLAFYARLLEEELNAETIGTLEEVSAQTVAILNEKIAGEFELLNEVSQQLEKEGFELEKAIATVTEINSRHSYKRMGIVLPDGLAYTTDADEVYMGEEAFFTESMQGKTVLAGRLEDSISGGDIIVYSVPIYQNAEVSGVLFAAYNAEELRTALEVSVFDGKGYSYVVRQNGDAVIDSNSKTGFVSFQNVYRSFGEVSDRNGQAAEELAEGLTKGKSGYVRFHNKVDKYMYYTPLGVNDWYVLSVVPTGVMDSTKDGIMNLTYILCVLLVVCFMGLLLYIMKMEKQKKKELSNILYVDAVTGGYSFARFCSEVPQRLQDTNQKGACIVMDIDKFKVINELFGYEEGNKTLCGIWKVLRKCSRDTEIYARRLADRFVALWYYEEREELNQRMENFVEELQNLVQQNSSDYNLKVTMGVYLIQDKNENVQKMLNYAMMAHATVKGREDVWYAFYDDDFREKLLQNKILEDQMKRALKEKEFLVYYQPKYNVMTKELVGAEALVRWQKKDGTMVMPGKFIPLAEKNGFINKLDKYIFAAVCRKQKEWLDGGRQVVPVSVNLSRRHLYNDDFMEEYHSILQESEVPVEYVQLELTESAIFENQEALCQIIDNLHMMGFRILMDDFGTGYSSLMMLKSVPIDVLKLDKSFVDDFDDAKGEKIITSVIRLAQSLHIEVTAEGVETEDQYKFLKELGCNMIQGYYFAKPMPEEEFEKLLQTGSKNTVKPQEQITTVSMSCI